MKRNRPRFDPDRSAANRDAGISQVLDSASEWRDIALQIVEQLARELPEFTADEVRARVKIHPHHRNAWGALMTTSAARGWIRATDRTRKSARVAAHAHRNPVWESLIYSPPEQDRWTEPQSLLDLMQEAQR